MSDELRFENLTETERKAICNGCGPRGIPDVVPDFVFGCPCDRHDFDYWIGCTKRDRYDADRRFLAGLRAAAKRRASWWGRVFHGFMAWRYYGAVRLLGAKSFYFADRKRGRADLDAEIQSCPARGSEQGV